MIYENLIKLSRENTLKGVRLSLKNSEELFNCASILNQNKKYGPALSLLILSIEELIKSLSIFNLIILRNKIETKNLFSSRNLHKERLDLALIINETLKDEKLTDGEMTREKMELLKINILKEKQNFNNWFEKSKKMKNDGLYVDFSNKFSSPESITENTFLESIDLTKNIREAINQFLKIILTANDDEIDNIISIAENTAQKLEE